MEKEITGCKDCPFNYEYDMSIGYGCKADEMIRGWEESMKNRRTIKQSKKWMPIDPEWCPLKTEGILIKLKK